MPESRFDQWVADRHDALWSELFEPTVIEPAVAFLAQYAGTGSALESVIGTGRIHFR